ncbi:MAG: large conductance mechanosensitive channel protein MscL [Bacilli bacterium]|nr:large conductance mechanosensitive channel protein MscL [Bacilli bacterium]
MRKFFQDFKNFIKRGNVLDLAVGIIIGGAFNTIVKSLVNDILMPVIGLIGGKNISEAQLVLVPAVVNEAGDILENAVTLNYGAFLQAIIDFLIISLTIFVIVKIATSFSKRMEAVKNRNKEKEVEVVKNEPPRPTSEELLTEIRDLLKNKETA